MKRSDLKHLRELLADVKAAETERQAAIATARKTYELYDDARLAMYRANERADKVTASYYSFIAELIALEVDSCPNPRRSS